MSPRVIDDFFVDFVKPTISTRLLWAVLFFRQKPQQIVFISQKIVLLLTNNEDRAGRRPGNSCSGAADGEMFPAGIAMRCYDDKIDIEFFGCFDNLMRRYSRAYCRSCPEPRRQLGPN